MTKSESKFYNYNFSYFDTDQGFVCAGIRDNIVGMYNLLISKGANAVNKDVDLVRISSRKPIVLFCFNSNTSIGSKLGSVQIMSHHWWNYYHNKAHRHLSKTKIHTYNLPLQWNKVLMEGCVWKEVEVLIPE